MSITEMKQVEECTTVELIVNGEVVFSLKGSDSKDGLGLIYAVIRDDEEAKTAHVNAGMLNTNSRMVEATLAAIIGVDSKSFLAESGVPSRIAQMLYADRIASVVGKAMMDEVKSEKHE